MAKTLEKIAFVPPILGGKEENWNIEISTLFCTTKHFYLFSVLLYYSNVILFVAILNTLNAKMIKLVKVDNKFL